MKSPLYRDITEFKWVWLRIPCTIVQLILREDAIFLVITMLVKVSEAWHDSRAVSPVESEVVFVEKR